MIFKNKEVIQSYILTTAKYDFTVHEKRILYKIIECNQWILEGKKLDQKYNVNKTLMGDYVYTIPIKDLLKDDEDKNHKIIRDALISLRNKVIEYEDERVWRVIGLIEKPKNEKYQETISFEVDSMIYDVLMDFSKGFRKYELATIMNFRSVYAMRFYELMSQQKKPITFQISYLKALFGIENKYKETKDFIRRVIEPAKKELDDHSPYSFEFQPNKQGRSFKTITFIPIKRPNNRDYTLEAHELQKQVSLRWDFDKITVNYLYDHYHFSDQEIKNNIDVFKSGYEKIPDFILFLSKKKPLAMKASNSKGYLINAIKKEVESIAKNGIKPTKKAVKTTFIDNPMQDMISELARQKTVK